MENFFWIFDLDGVLVDSTSIGINSLIEAARQSKVNTPTFKEVKTLWGHALENELVPILADSLCWPLSKDKEVVERFYEISYAQKYPMQTGLAEDLKELASRCRLGILSNRDRISLEYRLAEQGIDTSIFSHIHTPEDGVRKPSPRVFDHFWNGAGFKPEKTVFVGDSIEHDLAAARSHEPPIRFVGITSGLHTTGEFLKAGVRVSYIFKNLQEVFKAKYLTA